MNIKRKETGKETDLEKAERLLAESDSIRVTAQAIKVRFLSSAWPIVDAYVKAALGTEDIQSLNSECRAEVWDVVKKLMLQSSDKLELNISSVQDILKAVECGECTFEEGKKLMSLYKQAKEIEVAGMGTLDKSIDGRGLVVNILNTNEASEPMKVIENKNNGVDI